MKREIRFGQKLELRDQPGAMPKIRGYAAVFNALSNPLGGFREKIAPGAFRNAVVKDDVRALVDHDPGKIVGRTKNGTLTLREDQRGLYCEISPADTSVGRDLVESIRRGDLDQMSFGFRVVSDNWSKDQSGEPIRELREVSLFDVSVVSFPAYEETSVSMRSVMFPDGQPEIPTAYKSIEQRKQRMRKLRMKELTQRKTSSKGTPARRFNDIKWRRLKLIEKGTPKTRRSA
jgi:uncharacterized protein